MLIKAKFCPFQRVQELEKENSLLKEEKEEMNQKILRQSQSSGGEFSRVTAPVSERKPHLWSIV